MPNPYVILGIVGLWFASLFGVGAWQHSAGVNTERLAWTQRDYKALASANLLIKKLQDDADRKDSKHENDLALVSKNYQEKLKNEEANKSKFIADVRNGSIVLRQPMSKVSSGNTSSKTEPSAGGCDGQAGAELQANVSEFLYSEADRANKVVEQLTACQQIVIKDREQCGKLFDKEPK